jgi:MFS family permease
VLADRFPKRRVLVVTQSLAALLALFLAVLTATGAIRIWMILGLAAGLGIVNALDNPTRQSFVHELVGPEDLRNAVTLNSLEVNLMRVVAPALAGGLIVAIGLAWCFFVNAISFMAVIVCLVLMRPAELHLAPRLRSAKRQLREGLAYVRRTPAIRSVLIMMTLVGTLTYEFSVTLTNLAKFTFATNALGLATLTSAMGIGAVLGGLATAGRRRSAIKALTTASFGFGGTMVLVAVSPSLALAAIGMVAVGAFSLVFTSLTNTILQLETLPQMRGRVMALWSVAFLGTTAIGAPIVGWVAEVLEPRAGILVGAVAALVAGFVGLGTMRQHAHAASEQAIIAQPEVAEKEDFR